MRSSCKFQMMLVVAVTLLGFPICSHGQNESDDPLWAQAQQAYRAGDVETGNQFLKQLVEKSVGDTELAVTCFEQMIENAGRLRYQSPTVRYATDRVMALERAGHLSANASVVRTAIEAIAELAILEGRLIDAIAELDRLAAENPHDLHYRVVLAKFHRKLGSSKTRELYAGLNKEIDTNHPEVRIRERSQWNAQEFNTLAEKLPKVILPVPSGSPIDLMQPDDPDGLWQQLKELGPGQNARIVDRLHAKALSTGNIVPWRDLTGLTYPPRAVDLHIQSLPPADRLSLRKLQTRNFAFDSAGVEPSDDDILKISRRFPWAEQSHKHLLELANRSMWAGRANAALRSYQDVLNHSIDQKITQEAQIGYWVALAQISDRERVDESFNGVNEDAKFPWMNRLTPGSTIKAALVEAIQAQPVANSTTLADLEWKTIRIPPVSPWSTNSQSGSVSVDIQAVGNDILVSSRNLLAMYDQGNLESPRWSQVHRNHIEDHNHRDCFPGYFLPAVDRKTIYARWGYTTFPRGFVAIDKDSGRSLWSNERAYPEYNQKRQRSFRVPINDVRLADGHMYFLEWFNLHDVRRNQGRRLSLVCLDGNQRAERWNRTIVEAGQATDLNASFERSAYQRAIYGSPVTVHEGEVYSCSNAGVVARSDIRDGQTEWVHYYGNSSPQPDAGHLGAAPIVTGTNVICMPRDSTRVFALDRRTGRVVWDNVLVRPQELLGVANGLLIIRGETSLVALETSTGKVRWHTPLDDQVLPRAQLIANSAYIGSGEGLRRFDVRDGSLLEQVRWPLNQRGAIGFKLHAGVGYLVGDKPAQDPQQLTGRPLNPLNGEDSTPLNLPLKPAWSIPRENARITTPPPDSPIKGKAFVLSDELLECVRVSARGAIEWRRFVSMQNAHFHFVDQSVILYEQNKNVTSSMHSQIASFNADDGRLNWQSRIHARLERVLQLGDATVFHDSRGHVVAIDSQSGKQLWDRHAGMARHFRIHGSEDKLHLFHASHVGSPTHIVLDPVTGAVHSRAVVSLGATIEKNDGKVVQGGYIEVRTKPVQARHLRLVALSEINGRGWASCAELHAIGNDAKNLPREKWKVSATNWEKKYNAAPRNLIDGDPSSWWHTEWKDHIPPHPHDILIDMGQTQTVTGIRYLPAVIINNNGLIRDYQLYVSDDGKTWGQPIAQGMLASRIHIENPIFVGDVLYFEVRNQRTNTHDIYKYAMDGKPAMLAISDARVAAATYPYLAVTKYNRPAPESLVLLHCEDDEYRFDLGERVHFNRSKGLNIQNNRLLISERGLLIADLVKKQFILPYKNDNKEHNRHGISTTIGKGHLLKIVHDGQRGQKLYLVDTESGNITEGFLRGQMDSLRDIVNQHTNNRSNYAEHVLMIYDGWNLQCLMADAE